MSDIKKINRKLLINSFCWLFFLLVSLALGFYLGMQYRTSALEGFSDRAVCDGGKTVMEEKLIETEVSEIEAYMMEKFEVPVDWETYRNDDWGIEFQYPADWEAYKMNTSPILVQELGNDELYNEFHEMLLAEDQTGRAPQKNPYISNMMISLLEDDFDMTGLKNHPFINLDYFTIDNYLFYGFEDELHTGYNYQIFVEDPTGKVKFDITSLRNYEFDKIKTELDILKTLKFTK